MSSAQIYYENDFTHLKKNHYVVLGVEYKIYQQMDTDKSQNMFHHETGDVQRRAESVVRRAMGGNWIPNQAQPQQTADLHHNLKSFLIVSFKSNILHWFQTMIKLLRCPE